MSGQWEPVPSAHLATVSLLPLAVIVLGLGSGAFMAVPMRSRWLLIPAGVIGVAAGFVICGRGRLHRGPDSRGDDVRELTRRGQEGPGRAEGCESSGCEPSIERSGARVRPLAGFRRADG